MVLPTSRKFRIDGNGELIASRLVQEVRFEKSSKVGDDVIVNPGRSYLPLSDLTERWDCRTEGY
jgi:hypothetical protein